MELFLWFGIPAFIMIVLIAWWLETPFSPAKLQRLRERDIERKKQQDVADIEAAYNETISKMNNAAGQSWRNITTW